MNENMENEVMGNVENGVPVEGSESSLGGKILGGLLIGLGVTGIVALVRKGIKKFKSKRAAKKGEAPADVTDVEYEDVTEESK